MSLDYRTKLVSALLGCLISSVLKKFMSRAIQKIVFHKLRLTIVFHHHLTGYCVAGGGGGMVSKKKEKLLLLSKRLFPFQH